MYFINTNWKHLQLLGVIFTTLEIHGTDIGISIFLTSHSHVVFAKDIATASIEFHLQQSCSCWTSPVGHSFSHAGMAQSPWLFPSQAEDPRWIQGKVLGSECLGQETITCFTFWHRKVWGCKVLLLAMGFSPPLLQCPCCSAQQVQWSGCSSCDMGSTMGLSSGHPGACHSSDGLHQDSAMNGIQRFPCASLAAPAVLCAGSLGWRLPGLVGATATGLAALLPRHCSAHMHQQLKSGCRESGSHHWAVLGREGWGWEHGGAEIPSQGACDEQGSLHKSLFLHKALMTLRGVAAGWNTKPSAAWS